MANTELPYSDENVDRVIEAIHSVADVFRPEAFVRRDVLRIAIRKGLKTAQQSEGDLSENRSLPSEVTAEMVDDAIIGYHGLNEWQRWMRTGQDLGAMRRGFRRLLEYVVKKHRATVQAFAPDAIQRGEACYHGKVFDEIGLTMIPCPRCKKGE